MLEKKYIKNTAIIAIVITLIFILAQGLTDILSNHILNDTIDIYTDTKINNNDLKYDIEDSEILNIDNITIEGNQIKLSISPKKSGITSINIYNKNNPEESLATLCYRVLPTLTVTNLSTLNFSNFRLSCIYITIYLLALCLLFLSSFYITLRKLRYSYSSIFYCGFGIWLFNVSIILLIKTISNQDMLSIYSAVQNIAISFVRYSLLSILIFSVLLTISNISLIRHEGVNIANVLGIGLSVALIAGYVLLLFINELFTSGSEEQFKIFNAFVNIFYTIYALLECFLIGSIICGTISAKHKPKYDKDYIIILGCQIKKDGTLFPLLKSRVDRAISFYNEQKKSTGKEAFFVPSGGQGNDEIISEGQAMANYLISQGINESKILVEGKSKNTKENMQFSKEIIENKKQDAKVVFSTTNYHVFRSGIISRQVSFYPDGIGSKTKWYFWPNAFIREVIGMIAYKWKSLVFMLIPILAFLTIIQFTLW